MGDRQTAIQFYNKALTALQTENYAQKYNHSFQLFSSACLVDPTLGPAWFQNGNNCGDLNWMRAAIASYRRALRCTLSKDERVKTLSNMSWRLHQVGELEESLAIAQQATELGPDFINAWINLSVAHGSLGQQVASVGAIERALKIDPKDNPAQFAAAVRQTGIT